MVSSRRSGSIGPRPRISSVICSSMRTRSARVRARPSSSAILPNSSSIWRRTSTWLVRSSFGSSSLISRFWTRNFASRNDSRAGIAPRNGARRRARRRPAAAESARPAAGPAPATRGTAGTFGPSPSAAGRARSILFSSDMTLRSFPLTACEESALVGLVLGSDGVARECSSELGDVARQRAVWMRYDERHSPIHRQDRQPAVGDDRPVDRAADGGFHIGDADALGAVGAVRRPVGSSTGRIPAGRPPPGRVERS